MNIKNCIFWRQPPFSLWSNVTNICTTMLVCFPFRPLLHGQTWTPYTRCWSRLARFVEIRQIHHLRLPQQIILLPAQLRQRGPLPNPVPRPPLVRPTPILNQRSHFYFAPNFLFIFSFIKTITRLKSQIWKRIKLVSLSGNKNMKSLELKMHFKYFVKLQQNLWI